MSHHGRDAPRYLHRDAPNDTRRLCDGRHNGVGAALRDAPVATEVSKQTHTNARENKRRWYLGVLLTLYAFIINSRLGYFTGASFYRMLRLSDDDAFVVQFGYSGKRHPTDVPRDPKHVHPPPSRP